MDALNSPAGMGRRRRRIQLFATVAVGAIFSGISVPPARAQSFNGIVDPNVRGGSVNVTTPDSTTTNIGIGSSRAVIQWNVASNATPFQPAATTANYFWSGSGTSNYTVLNIINNQDTANPVIAFNGTVNAFSSGIGTGTGGQIWFYNPGGIIVGSTGRFNVGSLMLTTIAPFYSGSSGNYDFNDGTDGSTLNLRTNGAASANNASSITIAQDAILTASNYIALIAPRIVQAGKLVGKGAIGMIAGEDVDLSISLDGGLFGISIPTGTSYNGSPAAPGSLPGQAAIVQTGDVGGPAGSAAARRIYAVAVPKNNAVTILLGGNIGYDLGATSNDGVIVLAAPIASTLAQVISDGNGGFSDAVSTALVDPTSAGYIQIGGSTVGKGATINNTLLTASTSALVDASGASNAFDITFNQTTQMNTGVQASLVVGAGRTMTTSGLSLFSSNATTSNVGGTASVAVGAGGRLVVPATTTLTISASAGPAGASGNPPPPVNSLGGTASLTVNGGTIEGATAGSRGGTINVLAEGRAGFLSTPGPSGAGGSASLTMNSGTVDTASVTISADGSGGTGSTNSGFGRGGTASFSMSGGTFGNSSDNNARDLVITADGFGAKGFDRGGAGFGGTATLTQDGGTIAARDVTVSAQGTGGDAQGADANTPGIAGNGTGGTATFAIHATTFGTPSFSANGEAGLGVSANGSGGTGLLFDGSGNPLNVAGSAGGSGAGGVATFTLDAAGGTVGGRIEIRAEGRGGDGGTAQGAVDGSGFGTRIPAGAGGAGTGGTVTWTQSAGIVGSPVLLSANAGGGTGGDATLDANGVYTETGAGGAGGAAQAGVATMLLSGTAQLGADAAHQRQLTVRAQSAGGNGGSSVSDAGGTGGNASGSSAGPSGIDIGGGSIELGSIVVLTSATGGQGGSSSTSSTGGSAASGAANFSLTNSGTSVSAASLTLDSSSTGQSGAAGLAGTGGSALSLASAVTITGGSLTLDGPLAIDAHAEQGTGGLARFAHAGSAQFQASGSTVVIGALTIDASAGPNGIVDAPVNPTADTTTGGPIFVRAGQGSAVTIGGAATLSSGAFAISSSVGASASGGTITVTADQSSLVFAGSTNNSFSTGSGGRGEQTGGLGGAGTGGAQTFTASNNGTLSLGSGWTIDTQGLGGDGSQQGGLGTGGAFTLSATTGGVVQQSSGTLSINSFGAPGLGASQPTGVGGNVTIQATNASFALSGVDINYSGSGVGGTTTIQTSATQAGIADSTINSTRIATFGNVGDVSLATSTLGTALQLGTLRVGFDGSSGNPIPGAISVSSNGGVIGTNSATLSSSDTITVAASNGGSFTAIGDLNLNANGTITATSLSANNISLRADGDIVIGDAQTIGNATYAGSGNLVATNHASISMLAGTFDDGLPPTVTRSASITINGAVTANGTIDLTATDSISLGANALVATQNSIRIRASNDIAVASGASVITGTSPLANTTPFLTVSAHDPSFTNPEVISGVLVNNGTISAGQGALDITADGISASNGTLGGAGITMRLLSDTPFGLNDGARLPAGCLTGSLCLGQLQSTGAVTTDVSATLTPATITLAGAANGTTLDLTASNAIILGSSGGPHTMTYSGAVRLNAGSGSILDAGAGTLSGATMAITANAINAGNTTFRTTAGDITIDGSGGIATAGIASAGRLGHTDGSGGFVAGLTTSSFSASGLISVASGDINIFSPGDITLGRTMIATGNALQLASTGGNITVGDASASTLGQAASATITGRFVTIDKLGVAGDATLTATVGALAVTNDVLAGGTVTASGQAVALRSTGALNLASLSAGGGGATLNTAGLLTITAATSGGLFSATSTGAGVTIGTANATGATSVNAANTVNVTSLTGGTLSLATSSGDIAAQTLSSAGTTSLFAPGAVQVGTLASAGAISAGGGSIQIGGAGALTFQSLSSISPTGDIAITNSGDIAVTNGTASRDATFFSGSGTVTLGSFAATGDLLLNGNAIGAFTTLSGQNVSIIAQTGSFNGQALNAVGTVFLTAPGNITVAALNALGTVDATARGLSLTAPGAMIVSNASADTGGMTLAAGGLLTVSGASSNADILLRSTGGGVTVELASSVTGTTVEAAGPITIDTMTGAALSLTTTAGGIAAQTLTSSAGTTLSAPGVVSVAALNASGPVQASGQSVAITSAGALTFSTLSGGTGGVDVNSQGALTINGGSSAGAARLVTGGALTIPSYSAAGDLTLSGATLADVTSLSGANVAIGVGSGNIAVQTLTATAATNLLAPGSVTVADVRATGPIVASGSAIDLTAIGPTTAPAALTVAIASGGSDGVRLRSQGALTLTTGTSVGDLSLTSVQGGVVIGTAVANGIATVTAAGPTQITSLTGNSIAVAASGSTGAITAQTLSSASTTSLTATGAIAVEAVTSPGAITANGASVAIGGTGPLSFTALVANTGDASVTNDGDLTIANGSAAGKGTFVTTGALTVPSYAAGGDLTLTGNSIGAFTSLSGNTVALSAGSGGISGQTLTASGTAALTAPGAIAIGSFGATSAATVSGASIDLVGTGPLTFASLTTSSGDARVVTSGALSVAAANAARDLTLTGSSLTSNGALVGRNLSFAATNGALSLNAATASGTTSLSATGALTATILTSPGIVTASGGSVAIGGSGDLTFASLTANDGDAAASSSSGNLTITTGSASGAGTFSAGRILTVARFTAGGDLTLNGNQIGAFTGLSGRNVSLTAANGGLAGQSFGASGNAGLSTPGTIAISGLGVSGAISLSSGTVDIAATGPLTLARVTATSGDARVLTTGALAIGDASTTGDLTLGGSSFSSTGTLTGRNVALSASGGALTANAVTASGTTSLTATGALSVARLASAGAVTASGDTVALTAPGAMTVAALTATRSFALAAAGDLTLTSATVTTPNADSLTRVTSSGGNVTTGTIRLGSTTAGLSTQATTGAPAALAIASAGTATLSGAVTAPGAIAATARDLVITGTIDGSAISLGSQTISVGSTALIGTLARTGTVSFANTGTGRSFIGGSATQGGYALTAAALGRVQASSIAVTLPSAGGTTTNPDVVIGALTLYGTGAAPGGSLQNLGAGVLSITTPGQMQVTGPVRLANLPSGSAGGLTLSAAGIDVITPSGSILQTDAQNAPAGTLDLDARLVRVASTSALSDIAGLQSPTAREARLAQNDGNLSDTGWLSANTIRFGYPAGVSRSSDAAVIYVQNSGGLNPVDRRGVTAGSGGVIIANFPATDSPEVFINGRGQAADATFVTGAAFTASIVQTGTGAAATDILVNGCSLASGLCAGFGGDLLTQLAPPQDLIGVLSNASGDGDKDDDSNKPGDPVPSRDPNALVQFPPVDPEAAGQQADDPVVGAGNETLWSGGNGGGNDGGAPQSFDSTIGVGGEIGPGSGNGGNQPGASNAGTGGAPNLQQPGDRSPGLGQAGEGAVGVGGEGGAGGEGSNRASGGNGVVTGGTPGGTPQPQSAGQDMGGVGFGADTGGSGPTGSGGGNTGAPGTQQGANGTNGATGSVNGRPGSGQSGNGSAGAGTSMTGTGGDLGSGGSGSGSTGGAATGGAGGQEPGSTGTTGSTINGRPGGAADQGGGAGDQGAAAGNDADQTGPGAGQTSGAGAASGTGNGGTTRQGSVPQR